MSTTTVIAPAVGRRVWFRPDPYDGLAVADDQPLDAGIAHVNADGTINISVSDMFGNQFNRVSVPLRQADDEAPQCSYAEWMPFQVGQAKAEAKA